MSDGIPYTVLDMVHGDSAEYDFAVYDPISGQPINLNVAGVTAKMAAVQTYDGTPVFTVTETTGITFDPGPVGTGHVVVPKTASDQIPNERLKLPFDLQISIAPTKRWTVVRGHIDMYPDVAA